MNNLTFGDQKSIDYKNAKARVGYKVWDFHECDCEYCTSDETKCPYCDSGIEPDDDENGLVKCTECEELAYADWFEKDADRKIINNFEKDNETN